MLPELLDFARKKEEQKALFPLWLAQYALNSLAQKETLPFADFLQEVTGAGSGNETAAKSKRTAEEILKDYGITPASNIT